MLRFPPLPVFLFVALLAAGSAMAQVGDGGHGGGRGGKGGARSEAQKPTTRPGASIAAEKPTNQIEIVGVITAIDPATSRLTIAYEPVDELNWPKGKMPFPVAKAALLKDRTVGERVRFKIEEHEIYQISAF